MATTLMVIEVDHYDPTYLWKARRTEEDEWQDLEEIYGSEKVTGQGTNTLTFVDDQMALGDEGLIRCEVSSAPDYEVISETAVVYIVEMEFTEHPQDSTINETPAIAPVIVTQPFEMEMTVPNGQQNLCEATHAEDAELFYQWQSWNGSDWQDVHEILSHVNRVWQNNMIIDSTNSNDVLFSPLRTHCKVFAYERGSETVAISDEFLIIINPNEATIIQQPEDTSVEEPEEASFYVGVEEADNPNTPVYYYWEASRDGVNWDHPATYASDVDLDSVVTDTLILNSTTTEEGEEGSPPQITQQPGRRAVTVPTETSFTVVAVGAEPLTYFWEANTGAGWGDAETVLSDATAGNTHKLEINSTTLDDSGIVRCTVTNVLGSDVSEDGTLQVFEEGTSPIIMQTDFSQDTGYFHEGTNRREFDNVLVGFDSVQGSRGASPCIIEVVPEGIDGSNACRLRYPSPDGEGNVTQPVINLSKHLTGDWNTGYDELYVRYNIRFEGNARFGDSTHSTPGYAPYWKWYRCHQNAMPHTWPGYSWTENRCDSVYIVGNFGGTISQGYTSQGIVAGQGYGTGLSGGSASGPHYSVNWHQVGVPAPETPGKFEHMGATSRGGTDSSWPLHYGPESEVGKFIDTDQGWHTLELRFYPRIIGDGERTETVIQTWWDGVEQTPPQEWKAQYGADAGDDNMYNGHSLSGSGYNFFEFFDNCMGWQKHYDDSGVDSRIRINDLVISTERIGHDYVVDGVLDQPGNRANQIPVDPILSVDLHPLTVESGSLSARGTFTCAANGTNYEDFSWEFQVAPVNDPDNWMDPLNFFPTGTEIDYWKRSPGETTLDIDRATEPLEPEHSCYVRAILTHLGGTLETSTVLFEVI